MVRIRNIREAITDNCFIIFMILTFASFKYDVPGFLRAALWIIIVFANLRCLKIKSSMDLMIVAYFIGAFLSLSGMLFRPYPLAFFLKVFVDSYIPVFFYFIGKYSSNQITPRFYNRTLIAILFVYIVGFYYSLTMPSWYVDKTLEITNLSASYTEDTIMYARFSSFLDSYHIANYGVFALCFTFGLMKTNERRIIKIFGYVGLAIIAVAVLLSRQRVAIFIGGLILSYYLFKTVKSKNDIIGLFCVLCILLFVIVQTFDETTSSLVLSRFTKEENSSLVSARTHQWVEAIKGVIEPVFGNGIGSGGHIAIAHGMHPSIADGSYFKVWLEGGIYSTALLLAILIISLWKAFLNRSKYFVEFPLLFFCMFSLLGANIIDMPYIIAPMWYVIGRIDKKVVFRMNGELAHKKIAPKALPLNMTVKRRRIRATMPRPDKNDITL